MASFLHYIGLAFGLGVIGLIFALLLLRSDQRHGNKLEQGKDRETDLSRLEEGLEQQ